jgi:signal transduction histidine kinase
VNLTVANVATAMLWSIIICGAVWLATLPLRRRSLIGLLASVVLTGTAASLGAVLGGVHSMLLPMHTEATLISVAAVAGLAGTAAAGAAARRLTRDNDAVRAAVADLGAGRVPPQPGRRLTAELEQMRSELRGTAEALARSREREQALESARRELVAWVSHDLRTPLAGLRAMAEALEDGVATEPEHYYKQIGASVDRLSGMVDDLFELSRIRAGSFTHEAERIDLGDLVSDCLAALEPLAAAQGVRLTGSVRQPATVLGDPAELDRALTNLVANAVRHTGTDGHVEVHVNTLREEVLRGEPSSSAEVTVSDQCGGIDAGDLPRIFEVGYRGETARTPTGPNPAGAGLGLAITRGIVEAHGGHVDVANTLDGCRFRVLLPLATT